VIVETNTRPVPQLVQRRSPEFPLGVFTVTLPVLKDEIKVVVIVTYDS
jgi:hypothetical protein